MPIPPASAPRTGRRSQRRSRATNHDQRVAGLARFDPALGSGIRAAVGPATRSGVGATLGPTTWAALGRAVLMVAPVLPAFTASVTERPEAAAVCSAAALAIVIGVLRWSPAGEADERRPVAPAVLVLLAAIGLELFLLASGHPGWAAALLGPIASTSILTGYLATFGFRSAFLLRRIVLLSLLLWTPVASIAERVVRSSIDPLSDLIHRRLAAIEALGATEHPWRVFTAMTDRGAVIAITAAMIGTAVSRRRLTARGVLELAVAITLALVVHHTALLASPIERYERSPWVDVVTGPVFELALGGIAALTAAWVGERSASRRGRTQNPSVTAAPDRDPVLFAVHADDDAPPSIRLCSMAVPLVLLVALVVRTVAS